MKDRRLKSAASFNLRIFADTEERYLSVEGMLRQ
jgi:hypothetical protein